MNEYGDALYLTQRKALFERLAKVSDQTRYLQELIAKELED
jgi:hypothetical protein